MTRFHPLLATAFGAAVSLWALIKPGLLAHYPQANDVILGLDGLIGTFVLGHAHVTAAQAKAGAS